MREKYLGEKPVDRLPFDKIRCRKFAAFEYESSDAKICRRLIEHPSNDGDGRSGLRRDSDDVRRALQMAMPSEAGSQLFGNARLDQFQTPRCDVGLAGFRHELG